MEKSPTAGLKRRDFLQVVGASAVALSAGRVATAEPSGKVTIAPLMGPRALPKQVRVGVVGGGFGSHFYWHLHPNSKVTAVCDLRDDRLEALHKAYGCTNFYKDFREFLKHPELDMVAVFTPPHLHVQMVTEAMEAGKHAISAVPAGLSVEELEKLLETVKRTGMKYMMAETSRFRPEVITCVEWARQGKFGKIFYSEAEYHHPGSIVYSYGDSFGCQSCQLGRLANGTFDLRQAVPTWSHAFPPMLYPTHCTGLIVPVIDERLVEVVAVGWGDGHESLKKNYYNNPFWNTTAFFKTSGGNSARVSVYWHVAAGGTERGAFYGDRMSFIMERPEKSPDTVVHQDDKPGSVYGIYQGNIRQEAYDQPKHYENLPEPLRIPSGHGGSHTFITHEFISAIGEDRYPIVNAWEAVAFTMPGVVAHQSALRGGECMKIKDYGRAPGTA